MKSAVETLGPTRVRLTVEVPFDDLRPSVDAAYKKVAQQVRIRGFRPGKVPPRILDQQVGRGTILQEAIQEALPQLYGQAIRDNEVQVLGHPELEVTEFNDGDELKFTAEVDVRPELELPDYEGLPVTVDDAVVGDEEVNEQVDGLRERFAVLTGVQRPVETGDYVMIDIKSSADGEEIDAASATGLSYEVGSNYLAPGLDEALVGLSEGESKTFTTSLAAGPRAGDDIDMTVTVRSVKAKELPELDDDFAQTASEFDTLAELRDDVRQRLERVHRLQQGLQARDRVLEVLLERVEVPVPEHVLGDEVAWRKQSMQRQLEQAGLTEEAYAEAEGKSVEDIEKEIDDNARQAIKAQFVLDAIAAKEEFGVTETDLTEQIMQRSRQSGVTPEQLVGQIMQSGQLGALAGEVLRTKALALILEHAKITDESGNEIDLEALDIPGASSDGAETVEIAEVEVEETAYAEDDASDAETQEDAETATPTA
ncbi:MAG TPA: trigger factor [Mycobacteriales bacterium]|nr:trigger factor [Mycobacteriales bacterium]